MTGFISEQFRTMKCTGISFLDHQSAIQELALSGRAELRDDSRTCAGAAGADAAERGGEANASIP